MPGDSEGDGGPWLIQVQRLGKYGLSQGVNRGSGRRCDERELESHELEVSVTRWIDDTLGCDSIKER